MSYRFNDDVRKYLKSLMDLMQYANSRNDGRWANQSSDDQYNGVYGAASTTVRKILTELHGKDLADAIMERINYGGNYDWLDDLETAVDDVFQDIRDREQEKLELRLEEMAGN